MLKGKMWEIKKKKASHPLALFGTQASYCVLI